MLYVLTVLSNLMVPLTVLDDSRIQTPITDMLICVCTELNRRGRKESDAAARDFVEDDQQP